MTLKNKDSKLYIGILMLDLILLLGTSSGIFHLYQWINPSIIKGITWTSMTSTLFISYITTFAIYPSIAQRRIVSYESIAGRIIKTCVLFYLIVAAITSLIRPSDHFPRTFLISLIAIFPLLLFIERIIVRKTLSRLRLNKKNIKNIVLLGKDTAIVELHKMLSSPIYGYNIEGVFYDGECDDKQLADHKTGEIANMFEWMSSLDNINEVYVSTIELDNSVIRFLNKFCDNHLIRLYQVPPVFLKSKNIALEMRDNVAVIASRNMPLTEPVNKFIKRAFDLIVSSIFLACIYPFIYIIVGLIIKKKSPGPIYFKQERTGMDGKVFKCIKFRSMKVNNDADTVQATKDDPRKYPFGDFMRKTNIDELPQFINVWKGEMSLVGPRPHMLKHTEEYSRIINKFMVRHFAKPGITGLAQVSGFRGETKHVEQMEGRVKKDIEYIENWTFWLDIKIMIKTVTNMIGGEKNAY